MLQNQLHLQLQTCDPFVIVISMANQQLENQQLELIHFVKKNELFDSIVVL